MKKFLCFLIMTVSICSSQLKAHEIVIEKVVPGSFSGVRVMENGEGYYATFLTNEAETADSVSLGLNVYDKLLQLQGNPRINVTKSSRILTSAFTGQFFLLVVADPERKTRTTIVLDRGGNVIGKKEDANIRAALLSPSGYPAIYAAGMNEFMFIRTMNEKKAFEVEVADGELAKRWSKVFGSADKPASVTDVKMDMDRTYLVKKEERERGDAYSVISLNSPSGDLLYETEFRMGDLIGVPGFVNVKHGVVSTAGMHYREGHADKPAGIFFARIDPLGKAETMQFIPWEMLKQQVTNDAITDMEQGRSHILFHDVLEKGDGTGYTLVGELYKKSRAEEAGTLVATTDFAIFELSRDGMATKLYTLPKVSREILIKGPAASESNEQMLQRLEDNNMFSYRGMVDINGRGILLYQNEDNGKARAYIAGLDSAGIAAKDGPSSVPIEREDAAPESKKKQKEHTPVPAKYMLNSATEADMRNFRTEAWSKHAMAAADGHYLTYNISGETVRITLHPVNAR